MHIARLDPADLDAIAPAWMALAAYHTRLDTGMGRVHPEQELWKRRRARYAGWLERPASAVFVARDDAGAVVAYAMVQVRDSWNVRMTSTATAELQTLSVLPMWRGQGVGGRLLRAVEAHLVEHGALDLTVGSASANRGALHMYRREGFRPFTSTYWASPVPRLERPADVEVTAVDRADVDALAPLWAQLGEHHDDVGPAGLPPRRPPAESFRLQRDELTRDDSILLRAQGGYVYARVGAGFDLWDTGTVGTIEALVVDAGTRGAGIGDALFAAATEALRERRVNAIELEVLEGNDRARDFYEHRGLVRTFESLYKRLGR